GSGPERRKRRPPDSDRKTRMLRTRQNVSWWILGYALVATFMGASPALAQSDLLGGPKTFGRKSKLPEIKVSASFSVETIQPGATAILAVTAQIPDDYYLFAMTDPSTA